jgi:hypothetical protein
MINQRMNIHALLFQFRVTTVSHGHPRRTSMAKMSYLRSQCTFK